MIPDWWLLDPGSTPQKHGMVQRITLQEHTGHLSFYENRISFLGDLWGVHGGSMTHDL